MNTVTVYGPYKREDGRQHVIVNGKTISYPKYLYEQHHKIKLHPDDTIDHEDGDFNNNAIDNLVIKSRSMNSSLNLNSLGPVGFKQSEEHKRTGDKNGMAKLTEEQVDFYRTEYKSRRMHKDSIIKATGLSRRTVENFLNNITYR
jgi:hypothetical protein